MPIIKSAKKRVRVAAKATTRNAKTKRIFKSAVKSFQSSLGSKTKAADTYKKAQSELDKAAKKHVMHKNKVARKQRQLAKAAKTAGVKLSSTTAKKTTPKTPAAKKPAARTSTKKTTTKKPAAKK